MTTLDTMTASDVPRWTRSAAHAVPLMVLPSALWRIALMVGLPVADVSIHEAWEVFYIVSLVLVSEGTALLTLGLVQPWGDVVPSWIPVIGGRHVRPLAAVVPALSGAAVLTCLWIWVFWGMATTEFYDHFDSTRQKVLVTACYAPLLAWGPLLAAVAIAYWRRRSDADDPPLEGRKSLAGGMGRARRRTRLKP